MPAWEEMWARGLAKGAAFDAARVEPAFAKLLASRPPGLVRKGAEALVPGCGRGYAVAELARCGMVATGVEIAPSAVQAARTHLATEGLAEGSWRLQHGDFFGLPGESKYELIYDCTFLCAIPPERRAEWAAQMDALLTADGTLVTLIFPVKTPPFEGGPPYCMSVELVRALLEPRGFSAVELHEVPEAELARGGFAGEWIGTWRKTADA